MRVFLILAERENQAASNFRQDFEPGGIDLDTVGIITMQLRSKQALHRVLAHVVNLLTGIGFCKAGPGWD